MSEPITFHIDPVGLKNIQAIFCDIDGTLIDSESRLHPETVAAVERIKDRIPFFLISGRNVKGMQAIYDTLGLNTPIVSMNGAFISLPNGKVLAKQPLEKDCAWAIVQEITQNFPTVSLNFYTPDEWFSSPLETPYLQREINILQMGPTVYKDVREVFVKNLIKMILLGDKEVLDRVYDSLTARFNDVTIIHNSDHYIEVYSTLADKGKAIDFLLEGLKLTADQALCLGDALIDLPMYDHCRYGVAVANARPSVLKKANIITLSNNLLGVKHVLDLL